MRVIGSNIGITSLHMNNEITPMSLRRAQQAALTALRSTGQHMTVGEFRPLIPDW